MQLHARMNVVDGSVLCPRSGEWRDVGHCEQCADMRTIEGDADHQIVVCDPQVERLSTTVRDMTRA